MKILGLKFVCVKHVAELRFAEAVANYKTFAVGGGQWSIEAQDEDGRCLEEFVGSNGQCFGEEPDDLWEEVEKWEKDPQGGQAIYRPAYSYKLYEAPDGYQRPYSWFMREAQQGRLHGCIVSL